MYFVTYYLVSIENNLSHNWYAKTNHLSFENKPLNTQATPLLIACFLLNRLFTR